MNFVKKATVSTKNFVIKHKVVLAFGAGVITTAALYRAGHEQMNEFLKEHDLYETYYHPEG